MSEALKPHPLKVAAKIKKITVKMMKQDKQNLPMQILKDGYNMRQKSKWVVEAVEALLKNKEWEGALLSQMELKPDEQDVYTFPAELVTRMNEEAHRVSMALPNLKANQSSIIRAAINRRLMGFYTGPRPSA